MFDAIRFKHYLYFIAIFVGLLFILLFPSVLSLHTVSENQAIAENNNAKSQIATPISIFNNNLIVAGITLIPGAGWIWLGYVMWNTGTVVASYGYPWYWIFTSVAGVFAFVELAVYAYVILRSIKLVQLFRQRYTKFTDLNSNVVKRKTVGVYPEMVKTGAYVFIVSAVVLLCSALIEYYIIHGAF